MLKMERGAARPAGRNNSRVVDMEDLKKARERRASSARHSAEQVLDGWQETRNNRRGPDFNRSEPTRVADADAPADDRPFWEQDKPFAREDRPAWQQQRESRPKENGGRDKMPSSEERELLRQSPRQQAKATAGKPARGTQGRESRQQDRPEDRKHSGRQKESGSQSGLKALLVLLALLALTVFIGLKVFEIQDIEVKGAETMTPESVIALSGIAVGENIFKTSLTEARANLESDPLVEVLGISRVFPDKITIEIHQRKPHAAVAWLDGYAIIDERGFTLDVRDSLPAGQYPLVTGIDIEPAQRGTPIQGVNPETMKIMQKLLTALQCEQALGCVSEINLADPVKLVMLTAEGLQIDLGRPTDLETKANWVASAVPELRKNGHTSGILYVTGVGSPVYSAGISESGQENEPVTQQGDQEGQAEGGNNEGESGDGTPA